MQSLRNNFFAHVRAVGVRSVDEINSQLDRTPQNPQSLGPIRGLAPNSLAGKPHRTKSKARHSQIAADKKSAGLSGNPRSWLPCRGFLSHFSFGPFRIAAMNGGETTPRKSTPEVYVAPSLQGGILLVAHSQTGTNIVPEPPQCHPERSLALFFFALCMRGARRGRRISLRCNHNRRESKERGRLFRIYCFDGDFSVAYGLVTTGGRS